MAEIPDEFSREVISGFANNVGEVEAAGGRALLDRAWEGPENLPSMAEIRKPALWIERMGAVPAGAGAAPGTP